VEIVLELIGWAGAGAIVLAYFLNSFGAITVGRLYQFLNLFGAFGVVINSAYHGAWPPAGLNVIWFLIAVTSLLRLFRSNQPLQARNR
jgi:hypothetical protein